MSRFSQTANVLPKKKLPALFFSSLVLLGGTAVAAEDKQEDFYTLPEVVVTAPAATDPLTVETDPKAPRQPVPAADGGGYLKNIPGFSATRKGGTAGDPLFRGLGGTRLNVLLDGTYLQGGCGGRMDPPTAYVFPESYDKIKILKGPESVLYGGGDIAGTVLFERATLPFTKPELRGNSSLFRGSFGRHDELLDVTAGDKKGYARIIKTRSHADNYRDGDGREVHSFYTRESLTGILGWTPDVDTLYEFAIDTSTAEAAYADRGVDGAKFDRRDYRFKYEKKNISPFVRKLEFNAYHNYIDHVMDNYSLRALSGMMAMPMAMNPDRTTVGGRLAVQLAFDSKTEATVGLDYQKNKHTGRMGGANYPSLHRTPDMTFTNYGLFGEVRRTLDTRSRLLGGLRTDSLDVENEKTGQIASDHNRTYGAFLRYEHDAAKAPVTSYIGIGHAERPADWWERNKAFSLEPEKSTQLDAGFLYRSKKLKASLSLFAGNIADFILITSHGTSARNINASFHGGEAELTYALAGHWTATATLAYTHGTNKSDHGPLPQIPPLEGTLGLQYDNGKFGAGLLWRGVQAQNRVDIGNGNEIGTDIGPTAGFSVFSAHLSYRPAKDLLLAAGVDNIFNKTYAEYVSRPAVSVPGFPPATIRVNEPGRNIWVKASYLF